VHHTQTIEEDENLTWLSSWWLEKEPVKNRGDEHRDA
jgi:hypothetical protein